MSTLFQRCFNVDKTTLFLSNEIQRRHDKCHLPFASGHQDGKAAREFIHYIAEAVCEKCAVVLATSNFMSVLTDGSQARKTGSDKEMVLIRIDRQGK